MSGGWLYGGKGDLFPDLSWTNRPSMDDSLASGSLRAADVCKAPNTGHGDPWYRTGQVCQLRNTAAPTNASTCAIVATAGHVCYNIDVACVYRGFGLRLITAPIGSKNQKRRVRDALANSGSN